MKRDDTLWKGILEDIFDDFLRFSYIDADEIFDIDRGFEFLDKELEDLFPQEQGEHIRFVDKLVKVWKKDGNPEWILVHIEVQGQKDSDFELRMFTYYYRILDKYKMPITAWAIFSDTNKKFHPNSYKTSYLGTNLSYTFNTYKILAQDEQVLKKSENPFAMVVLTVLTALRKGKTTDTNLLALKLEVVKHLLSRNIKKEKVRQLMNFLRFYVRFNTEENDILYENTLNNITGKTYPMGLEQLLLDKAEKKGIKKGEAKGEKRGIEKGIERGIEKGIEKDKKEVILNAFKNNISIPLIANIVNWSEEKVMEVLKAAGLV